MRKTTKSAGEKIVKDIKRATRKQYSSEEKIRIVLDGCIVAWFSPFVRLDRNHPEAAVPLFKCISAQLQNEVASSNLSFSRGWE